jgi:hypothetical protein
LKEIPVTEVPRPSDAANVSPQRLKSFDTSYSLKKNNIPALDWRNWCEPKKFGNKAKI